MKLSSALALIIIALSVSGCGKWNSVYRTHKFVDDKSALIDIKQRGIISKGDITCAEPSPDALAAYAGELAAKADIAGKKAGELTGAYQEAASFVGMRSHSIQLLRDQMFRLCEARMNGNVTQGQYEMLLVRNQKYTVLLMAIEQLTGALQVPVVSLTTTSSAEILHGLEEDKNQLKELEGKKAAVQAEIMDNKPSQEQTEKISSYEKEIAALKIRIDKGAGSLASGSSSQYVGTYPGRSGDTAQVAGKVKDMVDAIFGASDSQFLCYAFLNDLARPMAHDQKPGDQVAKNLLFRYCAGILFAVKGDSDGQGQQVVGVSSAASPISGLPGISGNPLPDDFFDGRVAVPVAAVVETKDGEILRIEAATPQELEGMINQGVLDTLESKSRSQ